MNKFYCADLENQLSQQIRKLCRQERLTIFLRYFFDVGLVMAIEATVVITGFWLLVLTGTCSPRHPLWLSTLLGIAILVTAFGYALWQSITKFSTLAMLAKLDRKRQACDLLGSAYSLLKSPDRSPIALSILGDATQCLTGNTDNSSCQFGIRACVALVLPFLLIFLPWHLPGLLPNIYKQFVNRNQDHNIVASQKIPKRKEAIFKNEPRDLSKTNSSQKQKNKNSKNQRPNSQGKSGQQQQPGKQPGNQQGKSGQQQQPGKQPGNQQGKSGQQQQRNEKRSQITRPKSQIQHQQPQKSQKNKRKDQKPPTKKHNALAKKAPQTTNKKSRPKKGHSGLPKNKSKAQGFTERAIRPLFGDGQPKTARKNLRMYLPDAGGKLKQRNLDLPTYNRFVYQAEQYLPNSPLPKKHRQAVQRYFHLIRPND